VETGKKTSSAIASLPQNLCVKLSTIPEAGMGVFAKEKLEFNSRFGPYRGVKVLKKDLVEERNTSYMWEVYSKRNASNFVNVNQIRKLTDRV
jgi:hypothetical protein